jgi:hypothetical protein
VGVPAHDHAHPVRPAGQREQPGQLGHERASADVAVSVQGRGPRRVRQRGDRRPIVLVDARTDRVLHPPLWRVARLQPA